MSDEARIPSPADWDITWGELGLILANVNHGRSRVTALMNRFYITEKTASVWLEGLRRWEQEKEQKAS